MPDPLPSTIELTDLPPRLRALATAIGLVATLRLVQARGGAKLYVPATATPGNWLAELIGLSALQKLVALHGHEEIQIDKGERAVRVMRDRQIVADRAAGASSCTLALQYGLTRRQVFNILASARDDDPPDLFATLPG